MFGFVGLERGERRAKKGSFERAEWIESGQPREAKSPLAGLSALGSSLSELKITNNRGEVYSGC